MHEHKVFELLFEKLRILRSVFNRTGICHACVPISKKKDCKSTTAKLEELVSQYLKAAASYK